MGVKGHMGNFGKYVALGYGICLRTCMKTAAGFEDERTVMFCLL